VYIYADIFMIFNIVLNGIILLFTALLAGVNYKLWRILFAAALGSIYALGSLLNDYSVLYTPWAKLLASLIIVLSAFPIRSVRSLAVIVSGFYIVSFLLGGAVFGWLFFSNPQYLVMPEG